jgi:hypothetical protein
MFHQSRIMKLQSLIAAACLAVALPSLGQGASPRTDAPPSYEGHYEGDCFEVNPELFTRDMMDVAPGDRSHRVRYAKAMYDTPGCPADRLLGLLELPEGTWKLEKKREQDGKVVDLVSVVLPRGEIRITHAKPGRIEQTPEAWLIITRSGDKVTVEKEAAMSSDLDLRWLSPDGLLYTGAAMGPRGADGYLLQLDTDNPLRRMAVPSFVAQKP